jgi:hypothetical protein
MWGRGVEKRRRKKEGEGNKKSDKRRYRTEDATKFP